MAAVKVTHPVTHFWTAFFSLLSAILTSLGLKRTPKAAIPVYAAGTPAAGATAAAPATATAPGSTTAPESATGPESAPGAEPAPAAVPAPRCSTPVWGAGHDFRSLPPTIKQRIRAEAHGSSPSVRHLPAARIPHPADVTDATDPADLADRIDLMEKADRADDADRVGRGDLALAA
ncbi:DUF6344 domain-containing protein [Streptomyces lavendulocolor]|uniref:DUF6344 domain-containing protein n=1 Tax=Streptomyces lavendulocolor TaxID=67316 RepID=UPI003C2E7732